MRHALYLPPFGPLAEPAVLADLAVAAEEAGWDGVFLWDHVLRPSDEPAEIADPWICLAAIATRTEAIRLGPLVTPLVRRRPATLARQIMSLDRLSRGRLTVGLGLGVDRGRELTAFGEITDAPTRGALLDEGAALLASLVAGDPVDHDGPFFTARGVTFRPETVQQPRPPLWFAARGSALAPVRRAARYEGLFPIEMDRDQLRRSLDVVAEVRGSLTGFDVAVLSHPGVDLAALAAVGATWAMHSFLPGEGPDEIGPYLARRPEWSD